MSYLDNLINFQNIDKWRLTKCSIYLSLLNPFFFQQEKVLEKKGTKRLATSLPYLPKTDIVLQLEFFFNSRRYHWLLWGHMTSNNKNVACVKFLSWVNNITKSLTSEGNNGMFPARVYRQPPLEVNTARLRITLNRQDISYAL